MVLTRDADSFASMAVVGGATLAVIGALWWLWHQEQSLRPSPISEYLAVGYGAAYYASLVFSWDTVGDRLVNWLLIIPPISMVPLIVTRLGHRSSLGPVRADRIGFVSHRLAAAIFVAAGAFLVLTVLAAFVAPVPLIAAVLHVAASRFYARRSSS